MCFKSIYYVSILIFVSVLFDINGASGFSLARTKRHLGAGTNPNNINVIVGKQQSFPTNNLGFNGQGNFPVQQQSPIQQQFPVQQQSPIQQQFPVQQQSPLPSQPRNQIAPAYGGQNNDGARGGSQQTVDTNNVGGTHESNVGIGGIQNFAGARGEAEIQKLVADSKNNGGSHQTNAGIGGLLLF